MSPTRIVSLVPSLTELLSWFGSGELLVGRTKFCTEPAAVAQRVPAVGGTKNPDIASITALMPDLVIANKEENRREDIDSMRALGLNVMVTDPNTVQEALEMIRRLGVTLGTTARADELCGDIETALAGIPDASPVPVYVGVWHNPMMGLGSESYGHSLIELCGGRNVLGHERRYPETNMDAVAALHPALILLPDEPFPFDAGHVKAYSSIAPARVVDGKLLWWYGSRMPEAIRQLSAIFRESRT